MDGDFLYPEAPFLFFEVGQTSLALPLRMVRRVTRIVDVTGQGFCAVVPETIISQGETIPLLDLKQKLFGQPQEPCFGRDRLILVDTPQGRSALLVDEVSTVEAEPEKHLIYLSSCNTPWWTGL